MIFIEIAAAFLAAPRRRFLPSDVRAHAHLDRPLAIGHGQTNSQPSTVAAMLRLLEVGEGMRVLVPGSGLGRLAWEISQLGEWLYALVRRRDRLTSHLQGSQRPRTSSRSS